MKKIIIFALALAFNATLFAQVKAGDIISGTVEDDFGPLMQVNVVEVDASKRIKAHGVTDINGNFSFKVVDPKDHIQVSYVGCQTQVLPINKKFFKIVMKSTTVIKEVEIKAVKKTQSSGLSIPVTEISVAQQTIDMKEFEGLAMTSVDEALQGRISGLDIVQNSGNLGAGTTMRLRGVSTIYGNANPLIVVNGNVWYNDAAEDFDYTNANEERFAELLNVNPEDIETISVLKDAAATAIWGSQGANGVIEIKTKRGSRGKTRVQYSFRYTGTWMPDGMKMLNGDDYTMYMKEAYFNPELKTDYSTKGNANYIPEINYDQDFSEYNMYNDNTDWVKQIQQYGQYQQHFVSLTGGGEKANFRVSGGYDHQTGSVIEQVLDRFTTRVALDYFVSNRITVRTNFDLTYTNNQRNNTSYGGDLLSIAYKKMPNLSVYEEDRYGNDTDRYYTMNPYVNSPVQAGSGEGAGQSSLLSDQYKIPNPVAVAHEARSDEKTINLSPEFILKYDVLGTEDDQTKLTYEGQVQFQIYNNDGDSYLPGTLISSNWTNDNYNSSTASAYKSHSLSTRHSLTLVPHFKNENHSLLAMFRFQYNNGSSSNQNTGRKWLPTGDISSAYAGGVISSFGTSAGTYKSVYMLAQVHYAYKGKYIFDATLRRDGSTKFGPDRRWGYFPGISARWNISDEKFMDNVKWVSMLSIRPGWGIVGNQPGSEGLFYSKYASGSAYMKGASINPSNIRLSDLRWEKKETWNLGFDFGLFDNKITADLSIYTQKTTDLLMSGYAIPSSSGYSQLSTKNCGSMRNNGWEFNINANRMIKFGKFNMDINLTFANNRNEILDMEETVLESMNDEFNYDNAQYLSRVQLNNPLGSIYGFRYLGTYQYSEYSEDEIKGVSGPNAPVARNENGDVILNSAGNPKEMYFDYGNTRYKFVGGDAKYEDINHDGQINELDIVYLGSSLPKLTGGFGFRFNYSRWSLNLQFNYRYGNKVINKARMDAECMDNNNNQSIAINWRWHNEGDVTEMPRAANTSASGASFSTYNYLGSDRFVEDASFLRLNYAQLSYAFDNKLIKSLGLSNLSLYLTVNNVFLLTKYSGLDPEIAQGGWSPASDGARTPRSKSFTLGVTVAF